MLKNKAKIAHSIKIKQEWLDEVKELIPDIEFDLMETKEIMQVWYSPTKKSFYGVFESVRQIINAPKGYRYRALFMPHSTLTSLGITSHLALYDNVDRDGTLDFYVGLKTTLDRRAKLNGFRSNFAWEFIHEILHGLEQERGFEFPDKDRTHDWEEQGRLKELLEENRQYLEKNAELKTKVSLLQQILRLVGIKNTLEAQKKR